MTLSLTQSEPGRGARLWQAVKDRPALVIVLIGILAYAVYDPRFVTGRNLSNIGAQASFMLTLALAQTVVLIGRGFDLSMGNAVSLISVAIALVMTGVWGPGWEGAGAVVLGTITALILGAVIGGVTGVFSGWFGANSFIISLGVMNVCYGIASVISGGRPVFNLPMAFVSTFNSTKIIGLPVSIWIAALAAVVIHVLLSRTVYGRQLYLVGANPRAALVAGINTRKVLALSFVIGGLLVALSALLLTARTGTGEPNLGASLLMQAIAAAVIGGVSLTGGKGGVGQALFGTLTIATLSNILNLMQVSGYLQQIVIGAVIILAIWLERMRRS